MSQIVHQMVDKAPAPVAPFSHAVETGDWVFLTGQIPQDPDDDNAPFSDGISAQTHRTMGNLEIVLSGLGLTWSNVLSVRVFLTHFERDYGEMNEVYKTYFPADARPTRTCIGVTGLAREALIEIDLIARRS